MSCTTLAAWRRSDDLCDVNHMFVAHISHTFILTHSYPHIHASDKRMLSVWNQMRVAQVRQNLLEGTR